MAHNNAPDSFVPEKFSFGPYQLTSYSPQSGFRSRTPLHPAQQCLVDNIWKYNNTRSFPDILHALCAHFQYLNHQLAEAQQLALTAVSPSSIKLRPYSVSTLEHQVHMLNASLKGKEKISHETEELKERAKQTLENDLLEREQNWLSFPEKISEVKSIVYQFVLTDRLAEQLSLQEFFRRISQRSTPLYNGLSFSIVSYTDDKQPHRSFSFVKAVIDLSKWYDRKINGLDISLDNLLNFGMVNELNIPEKEYAYNTCYRKFIRDRQLSHICDHLIEGNMADRGHININFSAIPPSFNTHYPDDCRTEALVTTIPSTKIKLGYEYRGLIIIPETTVPILDQVYNYRALMLTHQASSSFGDFHSLVAESRNMKVYWNNSFYGSIYVPFPSLFQEDPELISYYRMNQVKSKCIIQGQLLNFDVATDDEDDPFDL